MKAVEIQTTPPDFKKSKNNRSAPRESSNGIPDTAPADSTSRLFRRRSACACDEPEQRGSACLPPGTVRTADAPQERPRVSSPMTCRSACWTPGRGRNGCSVLLPVLRAPRSSARQSVWDSLGRRRVSLVCTAWPAISSNIVKGRARLRVRPSFFRYYSYITGKGWLSVALGGEFRSRVSAVWVYRNNISKYLVLQLILFR